MHEFAVEQKFSQIDRDLQKNQRSGIPVKQGALKHNKQKPHAYLRDHIGADGQAAIELAQLESSGSKPFKENCKQDTNHALDNIQKNASFAGSGLRGERIIGGVIE